MRSAFLHVSVIAYALRLTHVQAFFREEGQAPNPSASSQWFHWESSREFDAGCSERKSNTCEPDQIVTASIASNLRSEGVCNSEQKSMACYNSCGIFHHCEELTLFGELEAPSYCPWIAFHILNHSFGSNLAFV